MTESESLAHQHATFYDTASVSVACALGVAFADSIFNGVQHYLPSLGSELLSYGGAVVARGVLCGTLAILSNTLITRLLAHARAGMRGVLPALLAGAVAMILVSLVPGFHLVGLGLLLLYVPARLILTWRRVSRGAALVTIAGEFAALGGLWLYWHLGIETEGDMILLKQVVCMTATGVAALAHSWSWSRATVVRPATSVDTDREAVF
jgi:hypothetical protein